MKIHTDCDQHSIQWLQLRVAKLTASEAHRLISPLGKVRTGDGPRSLLIEKIAERWLGSPLPQTFTSFATEQGEILESFARPAFELETGLVVKQVAFIETDDGKCGCSPDGIIEGKEIGVEIKSPQLPNHIRYLLDGCVPEDYILQLQFSLFVTGWSQWMFTSFKRGMPPLILTVQRDDKIQASIAQAVSEFNERMDEAWAKLVKLNGGEPPKRAPFVPSSADRPRFSWEQRSEMPS